MDRCWSDDHHSWPPSPLPPEPLPFRCTPGRSILVVNLRSAHTPARIDTTRSRPRTDTLCKHHREPPAARCLSLHCKASWDPGRPSHDRPTFRSPTNCTSKPVKANLLERSLASVPQFTTEITSSVACLCDRCLPIDPSAAQASRIPTHCCILASFLGYSPLVATIRYVSLQQSPL